MPGYTLDPPPPSTTTLPPRPHDHSWVKPVAIYGSIGVAVVLVGYGIYQYIEGGSEAAAIAGCEAQWQEAYATYSADYQSFIKANGGAALTQQQTTSLQGYVTIMDNAETCMVNAGAAQTTAWTSFFTKVAYAIIAALGAVAAFNAYLAYRGGKLSGGAEARAAGRNALTKTALDNQEVSPDDAAGLFDQTSSTASAEASAEASSLSQTGNAAVAAAEAEGDTSAVESIQLWLTDVVDTLVVDVTLVYDWFVALLA